MFTSMLVVAACAVAAHAQIQFSLDLVKAEEPVVLVSATNQFSRNVSFTEIDSPFHSHFIANSFDVLHVDSKTLAPFIGPLARLAGLSKDDYITLAPGQMIQKKVYLPDFYELNQAGTYEIELNGQLTDIALLDGSAIPHSFTQTTGYAVRSGKVAWKHAGGNTKYYSNIVPPSVMGPNSTFNLISFRSCSASQQSDANKGWSIALEQLAWATDDLANFAGRSTAYTRWFGTTQYFSTVQSTFTKTTQARTRNFQTIDCAGSACTSNTYAYVYPSDSSQTIYLCGAYWRAVDGDKGATMVHELTHFNVNGGTNDYVYGVSGCEALARSNPRNAANNADNLCFYAWLH